VAPRGTNDLLVVADPVANFSNRGDLSAILAAPAHAGDLTADQWDNPLPGAGQYGAQLQQTMTAYGITSLEQRAMFLAQLGVESNNLQNLAESPSPGHDDYFVTHYWLPTPDHRDPLTGTKWHGLDDSIPVTDGLELILPASGTAPMHHTYDLYWAPGPGTGTGTLDKSATPFVSVDFTRVNLNPKGQPPDYVYTYTFNPYNFRAGAANPPDYQDLTKFPHLVVKDHGTGAAKLDIVNTLGDWSPQDAAEFRGGGPIQLTGRHNYQAFADYAGRQDLMSPGAGYALLSDAAHLQLGLDAAGWYWKVYAGDLNARTNGFAWQRSSVKTDPFIFKVSQAINGLNSKTHEPNGLAMRLANYLRIRAQLLGTNF
jgi:predicted chitinase